jgi:hypothetical protein
LVGPLLFGVVATDFFCILKIAFKELTGINDIFQVIAGLLNIRVAKIPLHFGCQHIDLSFLLKRVDLIVCNKLIKLP